MKTIANALGVARSNLVAQVTTAAPRRRRGRRPQPEAELLGPAFGESGYCGAPTGRLREAAPGVCRAKQCNVVGPCAARWLDTGSTWMLNRVAGAAYFDL